MISICIPIYNFDATNLIDELDRQIKQLPYLGEIVIIDDASDNSFKKLNEKCCSKHRYIELPQNVGRASIRNLFLEYAQFEYLLFLDCDSLITQPDFVNNYLVAISSLNAQVICGGRVYHESKPPMNRRLSWLHGIRKESQSAYTRCLSPNKSFMTNNFVIKKELLGAVKFDERLKVYGHEDTLFGFELKKRGVIISHIENPVLNGDIEKNCDFITKSELGVSNLVQIVRYLEYDSNFTRDIRLLNFHKSVQRKHLSYPLLVLFLLFRYPIKALFCMGLVWLPMFDFYKLGLFIKLSLFQK